MSDLNLETTLTANAGPLNAALQAGSRGVQEFSAEAVAASKAQTAATTASTATLNTQTDALKRVQTEATKAGAAQERYTRQAREAAEGNRQVAAAMRTLPAQFTDIATQLQGGANPLTILLQQGGQIKDSFGGIRPAVQGILSLLTPTAVGLGALAAVGGTMAFAMYQGATEVSALNKQLALMGPNATLSSGGVLRLAEGVAAVTRTPVGQVKELTAELLRVQVIGTSSLEVGTRAGLALQKLTGQTAAEVAEQFSGMSSGVAAWAAKANASYAFLSAAQYNQVRSLEAQGRSSEAVRLVLAELAATMEQRLQPTLGAQDRTLQSLSVTWSKFWDSLKSKGEPETAEQQLASLQRQLQDVEGQLPILDQLLLRFAPNSFGGQEAAAAAAAVRARLSADEQARRGAANRSALNAAERGAAAKAEQEQIEKLSASHQAALAAIEKAGAAQRLAATTVSLASQQAASELSFQRAEISASTHQANLLKIDLARIAAQETQLKRLRDIEAGRKPANETDALQQQAALAQIDAQRTALQEKRVRLLADEQQGLRTISPKVTQSDPRDALRAFKAQDERNVEQALKERSAESTKAQAELVAANKAMGIALIRDDRARGLAQIEAEEDVLRKRLDLASLNAEERRRVEEDLATWRVRREAELTEQLKPEWQRRLEAWQDMNKAMQMSYDSLMTTFVDEGEKAFVEWQRTGKLNARGMVTAIGDELAKLAYRRYLAGAVSSGADWLMNAIGMSLGSGLSIDTGGYGIGSSSGTVGLPTRGGAATGTNFVERDMLTIIHKGEAVVPKQFNPWAGGSGGAVGGQPVVQNVTYNVPAGQSPAAYAAALEQNNQRLEAKLLGDMARPGRPANRAAAAARY